MFLSYSPGVSYLFVNACTHWYPFLSVCVFRFGEADGKPEQRALVQQKQWLWFIQLKAWAHKRLTDPKHDAPVIYNQQIVLRYTASGVLSWQVKKAVNIFEKYNWEINLEFILYLVST